jgi:hypothetical protein
VKVHTTTRPIGANERWTRDGMVIASATRSILDAAEAASAPEQIEMAIIQAVGGKSSPRSCARGLSSAVGARRRWSKGRLG